MKRDCLGRPLGRLFCCLISIVVAAGLSFAQAPATTAIRDVVYRADGTPARGQVVISWPAFTTASQKSVAAGTLTVKLGEGGSFDVALAPNVGATPEGSYYKVIFHLDGAPPSTEAWSVPAVAETTISVVRATVMPVNAAVQVASRAYVDSAIAGKAASGANADITSLALGNGAPWVQRDAADALGLWRGANPQRFNLYNTRTDAANYERLSASWSGNAAYLRTESGGTGTVRPLRLGAGEAPSFELQPGKAIALGVLSADGYLDMSGTAAYPINLDPPAFGGTGVGWKLGLWQNVYALGIANNTVAVKSGKWLSVFNGNPANDASSSAPDSAAGVSLGGDGTLIAGAGKFTTAQFEGQPWYDVTAYGAACNGSTDDTAAIQATLDAAVTAGGGTVYFPPGKTCVVAGTVTKTAINNITFLGYGTKLYGTSSTGPIMNLGDATGATFSNFVKIIGLTLTNGAWPNGVYQAGQSSKDGIVLRTMRQVYVDVAAVNLGGRAVVVSGVGGTSPFEWATVRVNAHDVGTAVYGFQANNIEYVVNSRRAHVNTVYLWDGAQVDLNVLADETLQPATPGTTDGAGVVLRDVSWSVIRGASTGAKLEALKIIGNSNWNKISGSYGDSSTLTDLGTSNIVLDTDGTNSPSHNTFNVWAGYTGIVPPNKAAYGIRNISGTYTVAIGLDATGVGSNVASSGVQIHGGYVGSSKSLYYNLATSAYEIHGQSLYKFDLDTDNGGGTPQFQVTAHNGGISLLNCTNTACVLNGSLQWGGGTAITRHLSATATLDFAAITAPNCAADLTIMVTGTADGDTVTLGVPNGSVAAGVQFFAWVSAANTVSVRACAFTGSPNPASGTFRVDVWRH